jgi:hypothetical protein
MTSFKAKQGTQKANNFVALFVALETHLLAKQSDCLVSKRSQLQRSRQI